MGTKGFHMKDEWGGMMHVEEEKYSRPGVESCRTECDAELTFVFQFPLTNSRANSLQKVFKQFTGINGAWNRLGFLFITFMSHFVVSVHVNHLM